jgi:hypothetical protein
MTTRWKDNFKNSAMELLFSTNSVLEVEEKLVEDEPAIKDNMEGREDGMRNIWDQGSCKGRTLKDEQGQQCDDDLLA